MRRTYFALLFAAIFSFTVKAQYVFNGCNSLPAFGDSLRGVQSQYDSTGITPGSAGANVTWTYALLSPVANKQIFHIYIDPATTYDTSAASSSPLFPTANLADSVPGGFISYYRYTPDSITYLGKYKDVHNYELVFGSEKQFVCPFNFGNSFSGYYHVHPEGICTYDSYITRTITYDAYGTLNFPHSSFSVARLKFTEQETDTFCTPNVPPGFKIDTTYIWYDITNGLPVFSYEYYNDTVNHYINKYVYLYGYSHVPAIATGVPAAEQNSGFDVFPNPSNGIFSVTSAEQISSVEIYNTLGEKVTHNVISGAAKNLSIDLSDHPSGVYFVQLKTAEGTAVKKIVVQR